MIFHYTETDKMATPVEIISSRVSVYEIELDLNTWEKSDTREVPDFHTTLRSTIASLYSHKCMPGEEGGFLQEVEKGTNFAHVIEHVLLELIHLADPEKEIYSGWTRKTGEKTFVIHYSAPDFLTGRLAAIISIDLVKRLIQGERPDVNQSVAILREPVNYFTHEELTPETLPELREPASLIHEIESPSREDLVPEGISILTEGQQENIRRVLVRIRRHMNYIVQMWRKFFFDYSGEFGKSIIDKIELITIDKFMDLLTQGDFESFFRGVRNLSHVISSYRIPRNFVVHSIWLYKNNLMGYIIEEFEDDREMLYHTVKDFELFYKIILQNVEEGSTLKPPAKKVEALCELQQFRELTELKDLKKTNGCVLVVDSDDITRMVIRDFLVSHGYRVILAESDARALAILTETGDDISLVLLDMVEPGMDKNDIYHQVRTVRPKLGVIISSSFAIDDEVRARLTEEHVRFIHKPYKLEKLLHRVKALCRR